MAAVLQTIFFVFLGYFGLGLFMWYFSQFFYVIGYYTSFTAYPLALIDQFIFPVSSFVYLLYAGIIFALLFKVFKAVFINKK